MAKISKAGIKEIFKAASEMRGTGAGYKTSLFGGTGAKGRMNDDVELDNLRRLAGLSTVNEGPMSWFKDLGTKFQDREPVTYEDLYQAWEDEGYPDDVEDIQYILRSFNFTDGEINKLMSEVNVADVEDEYITRLGDFIKKHGMTDQILKYIKSLTLHESAGMILDEENKLLSSRSVKDVFSKMLAHVQTDLQSQLSGTSKPKTAVPLPGSPPSKKKTKSAVPQPFSAGSQMTPMQSLAAQVQAAKQAKKDNKLASLKNKTSQAAQPAAQPAAQKQTVQPAAQPAAQKQAAQKSAAPSFEIPSGWGTTKTSTVPTSMSYGGKPASPGASPKADVKQDDDDYDEFSDLDITPDMFDEPESKSKPSAHDDSKEPLLSDEELRMLLGLDDDDESVSVDDLSDEDIEKLVAHANQDEFDGLDFDWSSLDDESDHSEDGDEGGDEDSGEEHDWTDLSPEFLGKLKRGDQERLDWEDYEAERDKQKGEEDQAWADYEAEREKQKGEEEKSWKDYYADALRRDQEDQAWDEHEVETDRDEMVRQAERDDQEELGDLLSSEIGDKQSLMKKLLATQKGQRTKAAKKAASASKAETPPAEVTAPSKAAAPQAGASKPEQLGFDLQSQEEPKAAPKAGGSAQSGLERFKSQLQSAYDDVSADERARAEAKANERYFSGDEVDAMVSRIMDAQESDTSLSDARYDMDRLLKMPPNSIKRIYDKVVGENIQGDSKDGSLMEADSEIIEYLRKLFK